MAFYGNATDVFCLDWRLGQRIALPAEVASVLCLLGSWATADELALRHPELGSETETRHLLDELVRRGLVETSPQTKTKHSWPDWKSEAAIFHFATRDPVYLKDPFGYNAILEAKAAADPPPPSLKVTAGRRIDLPVPDTSSGLATTLRARRTWRQFSKRPLLRSHLATLLQLTWGVQHRVTIPGQGRFVRKTSPSGGARHPLEAYVIVLNVEGLPRGAYHYAAGDHQLVDLQQDVSRRLMTRLLANQFYFGQASAFIVMSAVFARTMWKYQHSRAYRAILAEAGHFAQTFCLLATALDLAPFCTMAFRDTDIERLLDIDGVNEAAMYVVGVGTRPERVQYPGRVRRKKPRADR